MKKYVLIVSCIAVISSSFADVDLEDTSNNKKATAVNNSFCYFNVGIGPLPFPMPEVGIGLRNQWEHHGLDVSCNISTIVSITNIKQSISYLYYFTPNPRSQWYFGCGIAGDALFFKHGKKVVVFAAPQFLIGKEYTSKWGGHRFLQASINFPIVPDIYWLALLTVSYGFAF